jgi:hypothetical protein
LGRAFHVFHLHAEMINPFAAIARRQDGQVDMPVGEIDRLPVFGQLAAASDLFQAKDAL